MCTIRLSAVAVLVVVLRAQTPDDSFRFALTGDSIIERRLSVYDEPAYLRMFDRIRSATPRSQISRCWCTILSLQALPLAEAPIWGLRHG
jgi:hypothetical protein